MIRVFLHVYRSVFMVLGLIYGSFLHVFGVDLCYRCFCVFISLFDRGFPRI